MARRALPVGVSEFERRQDIERDDLFWVLKAIFAKRSPPKRVMDLGKYVGCLEATPLREYLADRLIDKRAARDFSAQARKPKPDL